MNLADDDFTLFALPRRFALDVAELDAHRRMLQAQVHPDRFAAQGAAAQRVAMQWSVRVNEAYRRLRDPLQRAAYLCELAGVPVGLHDNTAMPPAFLLQQMQWREALAEAGDAAAIEAIDAEVAAAQRRMLDDLARQIDDEGDFAAAAGTVRALMFVARFRDDVARRLDALGQ
ncbi:Fe-S protein assembly co-chaperone HscB [Calidifontimicrobium sp. SYSU G02091]|uniref:Fe-S protein assembly co-chaperone HscB n=1 Tax=Calidifontimicrobium sp. SYSU G02091 TaxID=2926421 RepID=UPI001F52DF20|nr:Fe-S protein assembly co-chaperone HscB [Calidifontimicrobium sp. SYSU G02091]